MASKIDIGTHGFVELVDFMPSSLADPERRIVEAARVSTGHDLRRQKLTLADKKLIKFLWHNKHMTPFEMCQLQFIVKCPIFVARQWFRHRTGSFNEFSGRYAVMNDEFYLPESVRMQDKYNKQMSDMAAEVDPQLQEEFNAYLAESCKSYNTYEKLVAKGVAKEVARLGLPVNIYTKFMWSVNLRNLMHFLELRCAVDAQPEIREFADAIYEIIKPIFPITCEAFEESQNGITFNAAELEYIKQHYKIEGNVGDSCTAKNIHGKLNRMMPLLP